MPSPFPGVDPFLESPQEWRSFHASFVANLSNDLNERLPHDFAARVEERVYVLQDERDISGDVSVFLRGKPRADAESRAEKTNTAVLEREPVADTPQFLRVEPVEIQEKFIEIVSIGATRQVVTVIELLSPTNKEGAGRRKYLRKQREILRSKVNLVEIDLLRQGQLTVAIPASGLLQRPRFDYLVCLNRADHRERVAYWPFTLRERLPRVEIPLQPDRPDVVLDLQKTFDTTYDRGAFDRLVEYERPVVPPLSPDDAAWVDEILRSASLRS